jgi:RHS repeat-associated protein
VGKATNSDGIADYYDADVESARDYYPFGMTQPGREYTSNMYRYGFNGKEDVKNWGVKFVQDYGFRLYNPAIGRFLSEDPLTGEYPELTPYQFASNAPIQAIDIDGLEYYYAADGKYLGQGSSNSTEVRLARVLSDGKFYSVGVDGKFTQDLVVVNSNHETFQKFAAMVYAETVGMKKSGNTAYDSKEAYSLASATKNFISKSVDVGLNYTVEDVFVKSGFSSAIGTKLYQDYLESGYTENWISSNSAVINALLGGTDYSNGAFLWDGIDFMKKGSAHVKYKYGMDLIEAHYNEFTQYYEDFWGKKNQKKCIKTNKGRDDCR